MSCGSTICTPSDPQLLQPARPASAPHLPSPFGWFATLVQLQTGWRRREELRELDDRILRDVGLTREQVEREARIWLRDH